MLLIFIYIYNKKRKVEKDPESRFDEGDIKIRNKLGKHE